MENNYGGSKGTGSDNQHPVVTSGHTRHSSSFKSHNNSFNLLDNSFGHQEEVEDRVVANTLNELDADILLAMENLSITDEDIQSPTLIGQNNGGSEELKGNYYIIEVATQLLMSNRISN
jgi:hypothetical protein